MSIQPYLFFNGRCEEAISFYRETLGAQATSMMRFSESPEPPAPGTMPPDYEDKIMHASMKIGDTTILLSDGNLKGGPQFQGFSLSLTMTDESILKKTFIDLSEGGQVTMAPAKTFWSPCFGMLTDRFGVSWMLWIEHST